MLLTGSCPHLAGLIRLSVDCDGPLLVANRSQTALTNGGMRVCASLCAEPSGCDVSAVVYIVSVSYGLVMCGMGRSAVARTECDLVVCRMR